MRTLQRLGSIALATAAFLTLSPAHAGTLPDFKVATYNVWGVPWPIAKDMSRYGDIAREMDRLEVDVILMQELFTPSAKKSGYVNANRYYVNGSGFWGKLTSSGLRILSRWPIIHAETRAFSACSGTDCLSRKGAVIATVERPDGLRVDVLDTHLNASGSASVRKAQLRTLALTIATYRGKKRRPHGINPLIMGGDFNFTPDDEEYDYALQTLQSQDTYREWANSPEGLNSPEDVRNGYTADGQLNSWLLRAGDSERSRLDYLWLQNPPDASHILRVRNSRLIMNERVRGRHLSDHYGVETTFEVM
jgi:endonuclease/exonuclease/phosphatase family metal-dependent hydrolase